MSGESNLLVFIASSQTETLNPFENDNVQLFAACGLDSKQLNDIDLASLTSSTTEDPLQELTDLRRQVVYLQVFARFLHFVCSLSWGNSKTGSHKSKRSNPIRWISIRFEAGQEFSIAFLLSRCCSLMFIRYTESYSV